MPAAVLGTFGRVFNLVLAAKDALEDQRVGVCGQRVGIVVSTATTGADAVAATKRLRRFICGLL